VSRLDYPFEFRAEIEAAVKPGDTVLDVGANVGQYTALLSRLVGPAGRVLAFEPDPRTHAMLESIVRALGLANVETFQLALGDAAGTASIVRVLDEDGLPNIGLTHLAAAGEAPSAETAVATLDTACAEVEACVFVKIDVEGTELQVLHGGARFLATRRPLLMIELDHALSARYASSPEQVIALLEGLGYELWKPKLSDWRGRSAAFRPVGYPRA
jgi:FkbM family methyltransferase